MNTNVAILIWFGIFLGLVSWYISSVSARITQRERDSEVQPPRFPDPPDMAHTEEMLQQANRQMGEAMRGMDLHMSQAMQQANFSMERAMEDMVQTMSNSRLREGNVVFRAGNATGIKREMRVTPLPSGGVSQTLVPVPPEAPKPPPVSEKLPPTIYERLNQDDD